MAQTTNQQASISKYVVDYQDPFLQLWPHRYDYLWAPHPNPGEKPQWQTESRHPLSDRLIQQGSHLYGVRFGAMTHYVMLDIDRGSLYHPAQDSLALPKIQGALEELGLLRGILCTSSYSGGLHLYFPFQEAQKTWEIALAVATVLENQGFKQAPGHLEIYPNPRNFAVKGENTLYRGHRLPLQAGSYLLNEDHIPVSSSLDLFVQRWHASQAKNSLDQATLKRILKACRRRDYRVTQRAEKFLNDLNAEIERGWTGAGMTNRLLGRITLRSYIFGHILYAAEPLTGAALVGDIVRTAQNLPGFYEWSNHVQELEKKAQDWARAVERTDRYFPYGTPKPSLASETSDAATPQEAPSYHSQLAAEAREKIRLAIATLLNEGHLPMKVGERFRLLCQRFHIGGPTLYKHRDLWHPDHLTEAAPPEFPPDPPRISAPSGDGCYEAAPSPEGHTSLLDQNSCNGLPEKDPSSRENQNPGVESCNEAQIPLFDIESAIAAAKDQQKQAAAQRQAQLESHRQQQAAASQQAHIARMRQYLASGDPILMAEALQWLQAHPDRLNDLL
ncbi:hypothetical protein [Leptolyngbya sp. PCC 6406]|uniref:hypothetical protein n=1 Tax=Leptolyngbya sp. PCC 6406 TaxID=1173264 RepID=UPI000688B139|nr:hypothetical protein [Leptolyngbya sp. PCC 6406]